MARKYTRDNRGRFASSGSGATARGGRLRTAAGNKRKTQTMKAGGAGGAGVMKGKVARDPGAASKMAKPKPLPPDRPRIRANGRPVGVISKPMKPQGHGYTDAPSSMRVGSRERKDLVIGNIKNARNQMVRGPGEFGGVRIDAARSPRFTAAFEVQGSAKTGTYVIAASAPTWAAPIRSAREARRTGQLSTLDPRHFARHEVGHAVHQTRTGALNRQTLPPAPRVAGRVSQYAKVNAAEFVAETYAGLRAGKKYDNQVMKEYKRLMGSKPRKGGKRQ